MGKKHHYLPVTYLKRFANDRGFLSVFRNDDPTKPFASKPEAIAFERYYYSQLLDDGERYDGLEQAFSQEESHWSGVIAGLERRETRFPALGHLMNFLVLTRVRGPAFRDMVELGLGQATFTDLLNMQATGLLPLPPKPLDITEIIVTIDPERSIRAMSDSMRPIAALFQQLDFEVIHNATSIPYLTSDNPVIYFNPRKPNQPFTVDYGDPCELFFPLTSTMLLHGRIYPRGRPLSHVDLDDRAAVRRINRLICKFSYQMVIGDERADRVLVASTARSSPVLQIDRSIGKYGRHEMRSRMVFAQRPIKPKWSQREPLSMAETSAPYSS